MMMKATVMGERTAAMAGQEGHVVDEFLEGGLLTLPLFLVIFGLAHQATRRDVGPLRGMLLAGYTGTLLGLWMHRWWAIPLGLSVILIREWSARLSPPMTPSPAREEDEGGETTDPSPDEKQ